MDLKFKIGTTSQIENTKIEQGSFLVDKEKGKILIDADENKRIVISGGVGEKTPEDGEIFNIYEDETINEELIVKNEALTYGHAEGESNIAGTKAFEVENIDVNNNAITLDSVEGLSVDDEYSIHLNTSVEFAGKITEINTETRTVTVDQLNRSLKLGEQYSNHWFWIPAKPTLGTHVIGRGTHAEGGNNIAGHIYSHAEGCDNIAGGRYSHAEGRGNKVAYAGHAEGRFNVATGLDSHAEGRKTIAKSPSSHTEGTYTVARASGAHAEGLGIYSSTDFIDINGDIQGKATNENYGAHGLASHSEGIHTFAKGLGAHAEGIGKDKQSDSNAPDDSIPENVGAIGDGSHSEGYLTKSLGDYSHSEGNNTEASAQAAHAEGQNTKASNSGAHSEGSTTIASGEASHAEGNLSQAIGASSHAEGHGTNGISTIAQGLGSHAEGVRTLAEGAGAHSEGADSKAEGNRAHVEGNMTYAKGYASHAEGSGSGTSTNVNKQTTYGAFGDFSHSEGNQTKAIGKASHAEGYQTIAQNDYSYAGGLYNKLIETKYKALDLSTCTCNTSAGVNIENNQIKWNLNETANYTMRHCGFKEPFTPGVYKIELNFSTTTDSSISYTIYGLQGLEKVTNTGGKLQIGNGTLKPVGGVATVKLEITIASGYQYFDINMTNDIMKATVTLTQARIIVQEDNTLHVVGNGTDTDRSNAFVVDIKGNIAYQNTASTNNADYAEYFEWLDGNENNEDRVGYVVALECNKIRLANSDDDIVGIVSGTAAVLGDSYEESWNKKYVTDDFGRIIYDMVEEFIEIEDEEGNKIQQSLGFFPHPRINPDYDDTQLYINRKNRPEWSPIGLVGKLYVRDDGTCEEGKYVKVKENGIVTLSQEKTNMRMLSRNTDNTIRVLLK